MFEIDINATQEEYDQFIQDRIDHMRGLASIFVQGQPVTPPQIKGNITYHTVRVTDNIGRGPTVEFLFQDYNLYLTAFRIIANDHNDLDDDGGGWFAFSDTEMPTFMTAKHLSYNMSYGIGSYVPTTSP